MSDNVWLLGLRRSVWLSEGFTLLMDSRSSESKYANVHCKCLINNTVTQTFKKTFDKHLSVITNILQTISHFACNCMDIVSLTFLLFFSLQKGHKNYIPIKLYEKHKFNGGEICYCRDNSTQ